MAMPARPVAELVSALDRAVPFAAAGSWDAVGLQVGNPADNVRTVAVCHDVTDPVLTAAIEANVDVLVAYHPLLFRPIARVTAGPTPAGRAHRMAAHAMSLVVVHTAFDVVAGGAADSLAAALDLQDPVAFGPNYAAEMVRIVVAAGEQASSIDATARAAGAARVTDHHGTMYIDAASSAADRIVAAIASSHPLAAADCGIHQMTPAAGAIGRRGSLPAPMPLADFAAYVETVVGRSARIAGTLDRIVNEVAVVPGSGASFLGAVRNADVLVTGDVKHHDARAALDRDIAVIDPGHAATERPGVARLYALVVEIADGLSVVDLTDVDSDPWQQRGAITE